MPAAAPDVGSPGTSSSGSSPRPPPSTATKIPVRRKVTVLIVVVVVVVASSLVAFVTLRTLTSTGSTGSGGGTASDAALRVAKAYASSAPGGPWTLSSLEGVDVVVPTPVSFYPDYRGPVADCNYSGSANYTFRGTSGTYSDGQYATWWVGFLNATGELFVIVSNSAVADHFAYWGQSCAFHVYPPPGPLNASGIPSTEAATSALATTNVSAFVANHSSANVLAYLAGGLWSFEYSTCSFFFVPGTPATGTVVTSQVNAENGSVTGIPMITTSDVCSNWWGGLAGNSLPISDLFSVASPTLTTCPTGSTFATNGCLGGDWTYRLAINVSYLTFDAVWFGVTGSSQPFVLTGPGGFSILEPNGSVVLGYSIPSGASLMMNQSFCSRLHAILGSVCTDVVPVGDLVLIDMGTVNPTGMGLKLAVTASSWFSSPAAYFSLD